MQLIALVFALLAAAPSGQPLFSAAVPDDAAWARAIREFYTKREFYIPMRDGTRLFTQVFSPKDDSRSYPILLKRTPYGLDPYGDDYPSDAYTLRRRLSNLFLLRSGYIWVFQDVRGRMMSEGTFVDVRPHLAKDKGCDESTDTFDTIDFLLKNIAGNSGKVGMWGISYPGFYATQGLIDAHPALVAVSPQAPVTEWMIGDDFHHNGAFFVADAFLFYRSFGKPRAGPTTKAVSEPALDAGDMYDFFLRLGPIANIDQQILHHEIAFWNDLMAHPNRDSFWQARDPRPHLKAIKAAVLTVGGWFDAEDLFGTLETYRSIERQNPKIENSLVIGPWRHGGWERSDGEALQDAQFYQKTSAYYRENIEFPFFERHLKQTPTPGTPEASVFETGTNEWHHYDRWPPKEARSQTLWLHEHGGLSTQPSNGSSTSWLSDPAKPVPYTDRYSNEHVEYMNTDQRFSSRRPDVAVFESLPLEADVILAGPIEASLWVATTGTDSDFVVKLVDVYPNGTKPPEPNPRETRLAGYQQLVRAEIMRGRYRNGLDRPEAFVPGQPTAVNFSLSDVDHAFRRGHRLMVQVQSSWFPLVDRNPQTFVDIYHAKAEDFVPATETIFLSREHPSGLKVSVLRGALP